MLERMEGAILRAQRKYDRPSGAVPLIKQALCPAGYKLDSADMDQWRYEMRKWGCRLKN